MEKKQDLLTTIKRIALLIPTILFVTLLVLFLLPPITQKIKTMNNNPFPKKDFVGVIQVNKEITQPFVDRIIGDIQRVKEDNKLLGLLFVFNSPGGDPSASQNFMSFLKEIEKEIPSFGYINTTCTSGCYYSAIGLDKVNANKNALIGSVGVLIKLFDASELSKKIGINDKTITMGEFKKPFSTINGLDETQKSYIKEHMLEPVYENFITDVIAERKIEGNRKEITNKYFEGKVFVANDERIQDVLVDNITDFHNFKKLILRELGRTEKNANFLDINSNGENLLDSLKHNLNISAQQFKIL